VGGLGNRNAFLKAGKSEIRVLADSVSGEGTLVCRRSSSCYSLARPFPGTCMKGPGGGKGKQNSLVFS
jgi:hypothetical protein